MKHREIKFRAWDKTDKVWAKKNIVGNILYEIQANKDADVLDSYCLSECTGLKDKNGKEIYESDIVKLYYKGVYRFCEIIFAEGIFCLKWDDGYVNKYQLYPQSLEVVGNIYETKIK